MTPDSRALRHLNSRIEQVHNAFGTQPVRSEDFTKIVVVLGSSRSGSSLLFHTLASSGSFWCQGGEETPIFRKRGIGWVRQESDSDLLRQISEQDQDRVRESLFCDLGQNVLGNGDPLSRRQFASRLLWQWPDRDFDIKALIEDVKAVSGYAELIQKYKLDVNFYDLPQANRKTNLTMPEWIVEEPPYVVPTFRRLPKPNELSHHPILLKTSTNCYRIPLLKSIFPQAQFHWIILTRNPAAGINGLMDGWLSNAFHSHNLSAIKELKIAGYSTSNHQGDRWWKFDLPPDWSQLTNATLQEICAFQWQSAYSHILAHAKTTNDPVHFVKKEDLTNPTLKTKALSELFNFLKIKPQNSVDLSHSRPVMATAPPSPARWRRREKIISPLLNDSSLQTVAKNLGYDLKDKSSLV